MLTKYHNITERGRKTQYKRGLATICNVTYWTVQSWITQDAIPTDQQEKVKKFNKEFFK